MIINIKLKPDANANQFSSMIQWKRHIYKKDFSWFNLFRKYIFIKLF